jgi:SAM-dependent methyltransferase
MNIEKTDRELFNIIADQYAKKDIVKSSMIARQHQILTTMKPFLVSEKKIDTIVDIGCGIGAPAKYLKGYFERYLGIDYSSKLINIAKIRNTDKNVSFINANIKNFNSEKIGNKIADVILIVGALHHLTELDIVMESLKIIAKPGACFAALEPSKNNPLIQVARRLRVILDPSYSKYQTYFSPSDLKNLLTSHNIQLIDISYQGYFVPLFAQIILRPQIISIPLCRLAIWCDTMIEKYLPNFIKKFSWNLIVRGKFV